MSDVRRIKKAMSDRSGRVGPVKPIADEDRISLGLTVLNVAVSRGRWADGGTGKGHFLWVVGESETGKTFWALQQLAVIANNPNFDDYELLFIDAENGMREIDVPRLFGRKFYDRLVVVRRCRYVEDFYDLLWKRLKSGRKFACALDSYDALDTRPDEKKFEAHMDARERKRAKEEAGEEGSDKEPAGNYGTGKAKETKAGLKRLTDRIAENGCFLTVISQVYDMIGAPVKMKTTAGGNALRYFAHEMLWMRVVEKLTKKVGNDTWEQGAVVEVAVRKNRVSGWHGKVHVTFLSDYGFDDVGSSVDFLTRYGTWSKPKDARKIRVGAFPTGDATREKIIQSVEESPRLQSKLRRLVRETFRRVDDAVTVKRKPRFQ